MKIMFSSLKYRVVSELQKSINDISDMNDSEVISNYGKLNSIINQTQCELMQINREVRKNKEDAR